MSDAALLDARVAIGQATGMRRSARVMLALVLVWPLPLTTNGQEPGDRPGALDTGQKAATSKAGGTMEKTIILRPIGIVHSPYREPKGTPIQGVFDDQTEAWVEVEPKYQDGFRDLGDFSHAILLYHFHLSEKEEITAEPYLEKQPHGIFATRSPHRPNHIGLSVVRIRRIDGNRMYFTEVDILDGTPVLDIKPYVRHFDSRPEASSGWIERHFQDGQRPKGKADR